MMAPRGGLLERWNLFFLITIPMSLAAVVQARTLDLSVAGDVSSMIQYTVRWSVPWLYLAFAASSLAALFPGKMSRWLLRNRRYIGLCFASGMAWQLTFIIWLVAGHWSYYLENTYALLDVAIQIPGYVFLTLMTVTSFEPGRRMLSGRQWRILHRTSIYFLWGTIWSTYWYELYYYDDIQRIDYIYYWAGFAVWGARMLAWSQRHRRASSGEAVASGVRHLLPGVGLVVAAVGLVGFAFGSLWAPWTLELVGSLGMAGAVLELAVPFLPIFLIGLGALLVARSGAGRAPILA